MWSVTTSKGSRVDGIQREQDARRVVHMLGLTEVISPYSWHVVDNSRGSKKPSRVVHVMHTRRV